MKSFKITFTVFILFALLVFSVSSCKKKCKEAGTGGNVTIVASLFHHTESVPNLPGHLDTVYLKYNTQNGDSNLANYDTYFVGEAGEEHVHLTGLKCGDYYIYGVGFDTMEGRVKGGIPYSFEQTSGEIDVNIPVTED
jgi:hypothetical protein